MLFPMIADADTETINNLVAVFKGLGVPGGCLLVLAWTLRKVVLWAMPHVERMTAAYVSRQKAMEDCQKSLTDGTLEIQRQTLAAVLELKNILPMVCEAKCPKQKRTPARKRLAGPKGQLP